MKTKIRKNENDIKNIELKIMELANRSYSFHAEQLSDGSWFISVPDLKGCHANGATIEEAIEELKWAKISWISAAMEFGFPVPDPSPSSLEKEYSGQTLLRMPKSLHRELAIQAEEEGVSLNQYIVSLLSERKSINAIASEFEHRFKPEQNLRNFTYCMSEKENVAEEVKKYSSMYNEPSEQERVIPKKHSMWTTRAVIHYGESSDQEYFIKQGKTTCRNYKKISH